MVGLGAGNVERSLVFFSQEGVDDLKRLMELRGLFSVRLKSGELLYDLGRVSLNSRVVGLEVAEQLFFGKDSSLRGF